MLATRRTVIVPVGTALVSFVHLSVIIATYWVPFTVRGNGPSLSIIMNLSDHTGGEKLQVSLKFTVFILLRASATITNKIVHVASDVWPMIFPSPGVIHSSLSRVFRICLVM